MNDETHATRRVLLESATRLFAASGYRGTSVREITASAGVNLGAITYHFGSKAELYQQAISRVQEGLVQRLTEAVATCPGDALDRIVAFARAHFIYLAEQPDQRNLMLQALLFEKTMPPSALQFLPRVARLLSGLITEGQAAGVIRAGDPRLLIISVMAQPVMLNAFRPVLRAGPGIDLDDEVTRSQALTNALEFIRAGLQVSREVPPS